MMDTINVPEGPTNGYNQSSRRANMMDTSKVPEGPMKVPFLIQSIRVLGVLI